MSISLPPLRIVYYTRFFNAIKFAQEDLIMGHNCPSPEGYTFNFNNTNAKSWCTLTSNLDDPESASALIFHAVDTDIYHLPGRDPNQPWILESLETPFSSTFREDPDDMAPFDYLASYHFQSTFLMSYFSPHIMDIVNRPLPKEFIKTKTARAPILWIARNCNANNGRHHYIKELMKYIDVDSYGTCLNNADFPEESRTDLMSDYKFYLAVENSNCDDYATEKLYDTFLNSAVPIVDGPPSYLDYIPNNRSIIHMDAYPDPRDLADYINYLDKNDTAYLAYLNYRREAIDVSMKDRLNPQFLARWSDEREFQLTSDYCSICRGIVPWWEARINSLAFQDNGREERFRVDQTCGESNKWGYAINGPPYTPTWTPRPRDEFTRPMEVMDVMDVMDEVEVVQPIEQHERAPVMEVHVAFVGLFIAFVVFLWSQARKARVVEQSDV